MVQRTAAADAPRRQWIQSRGWDAFWIFSGLWAPLSVLLLHAAMSGGDLHGLREAPAFHQQRALAPAQLDPRRAAVPGDAA
jgi:hypothetical protein